MLHVRSSQYIMANIGCNFQRVPMVKLLLQIPMYVWSCGYKQYSKQNAEAKGNFRSQRSLDMLINDI